MKEIITAILLAASLCADCFAVSICSSVTLKKSSAAGILPVALSFAVVQTLLLFLGWFFGDLFASYVSRIADIIGFLLLLYVGGSMLIESFSKNCESRNLSGWKNVVLGAIATSIDAFAVGVSLSMEGIGRQNLLVNLASLFIITFFSVVFGIMGGSRLGGRFGASAERIGGCVLILIGVNILFSFI